MDKWILKVPEWKGAIIFDYETVFFIIVIAMIISGLVLCFMGYRYFQTLCTVVVGCILGFVGIQLGEAAVQNVVLKMSLFVMIAFMGTFLFYVILIPVKIGLRKLPFWEQICKKQYIFAAILGAGTVGIVAYQCVYRSLPAAIILFVGLTLTGAWWGKRQAAKRRPFYTYDDLYHREPLPEKGETL